MIQGAMRMGWLVLSRQEASDLGAKFGVHPRTIHRWKAKGIDIRSPEAVAHYLATSPRPSPKAIAAILRTLEINK